MLLFNYCFKGSKNDFVIVFILLLNVSIANKWCICKKANLRQASRISFSRFRRFSTHLLQNFHPNLILQFQLPKNFALRLSKKKKKTFFLNNSFKNLKLQLSKFSDEAATLAAISKHCNPFKIK